MKTLELHYAKQMRYEGEENQYLTWYWNDDQLSGNYGWNKHPVPDFSCGEVAGGKVDDDKLKEVEAWFITSNREDTIFLEKELMACQYWYDGEKNEITTAQNILQR